MIGNLGLTNRAAPVRLTPEEDADVVYHTKPSLFLVVNTCEDPYWLRVLGKHGQYGYIRSMDVQDLGYPLRKKARSRVIL